ncbi:uncharacterized protein LOC144578509 [Callithrix jacchus]
MSTVRHQPPGPGIGEEGVQGPRVAKAAPRLGQLLVDTRALVSLQLLQSLPLPHPALPAAPLIHFPTDRDPEMARTCCCCGCCFGSSCWGSLTISPPTVSIFLDTFQNVIQISKYLKEDLGSQPVSLMCCLKACIPGLAFLKFPGCLL